jgi:hypothetical protein
LLGYPRCCVEAFVERVQRGVTVRRDRSHASEEIVAAEEALSRSEDLLGRLNVLSSPRDALVPFFPCRFDCDPALRYASALFEALRERNDDGADALRAALCVEVALPRDRLRFERF